MNNLPAKFYTDFLGLGYIVSNVSNFVMIFSNKSDAVKIWKKIMKAVEA